MGGILRADANVEKYRAVWQISGSLQPNVHVTAIRYFKSICQALERDDLITELDQLIYLKIERPLGCDILRAEHVFKNLPALNAYTRTQSEFVDEYGSVIYKWQLNQSFEEIMDWMFRNLVQLEPDIRFSSEKPLL